MDSILSKLALDAWYKVMIWIGTFAFIATAAGLLPKLPTKPSLLISLGAIFFGLGEWKNHPLKTILQEAWGRQFLASGHKRAFSFTGTVLCFFGLFLAYLGAHDFF